MQGDIESMDWRMYFSEGGKAISPWHDIPLSSGGSTYNFVCEIPKETKAKMECSLVRFSPAAYAAFPSYRARRCIEKHQMKRFSSLALPLESVLRPKPSTHRYLPALHSQGFYIRSYATTRKSDELQERFT